MRHRRRYALGFCCPPLLGGMTPMMMPEGASDFRLMSALMLWHAGALAAPKLKGTITNATIIEGLKNVATKLNLDPAKAVTQDQSGWLVDDRVTDHLQQLMATAPPGGPMALLARLEAEGGPTKAEMEAIMARGEAEDAAQMAHAEAEARAQAARDMARDKAEAERMRLSPPVPMPMPPPQIRPTVAPPPPVKAAPPPPPPAAPTPRAWYKDVPWWAWAGSAAVVGGLLLTRR